MIKRTRLRVSGGKIQYAPSVSHRTGQHSKSNKFTDVRICDIPRSAIISSEGVISKGKTMTQILADQVKKFPNTFWLVFNASYFNQSSGLLAGKTIKDGKIMFSDVLGKTEKRPHLYCKSGVIGIGRVDDPKSVSWAFNIVPSLTSGGRKVYPNESEKLQSDMRSVNNRIIFGVKHDGTFGLVLVDGRGGTDYGINSDDAEVLMYELDYSDSAIGDSGGSAGLASNCRPLLDKLNVSKTRNYHVSDMSANQKPRIIHHAVCIRIDPTKM